MAIPLFLALDSCELPNHRNPSQKIAWMVSPFSSENDWITRLPSNAMIVLTDRQPIGSCDPTQVAGMLAELSPIRVLLDFQRPGDAAARHFAAALVDTLSCPVGVSAEYAQGLPCPVLLPPVPPNILPQDHLSPWDSREIWLEAALDACQISVTADGCRTSLFPFAQAVEHAHRDDMLHCHYSIRHKDDALEFYLYRTREDALSMLSAIDAPNVTLAVGLFQELGQDDK